MARDIADLVKGKPVKDVATVSEEHSERMNQLIADYDKDLRNNWHPHRQRLAWPKGISK